MANAKDLTRRWCSAVLRITAVGAGLVANSVLAAVPLTGVASVAAGAFHGCALTSAGGVKCWGDNGNGQLGDGTHAQALTATDVSGLTSGVAKVAVGGSHSCAMTLAGGVLCWGANGVGQLGDGTAADAPTPVFVSGLSSGATAIAAGWAHACALTGAGGVKCWGGGGTLGNGSGLGSPMPVDVVGLPPGMSAVVAGGFHSCALTGGGGVKCWGRNNVGQLGNGTTTDAPTPTDVSGLASGVTAIAGGMYHGCALTTAGGVKCWGNAPANGSSTGTLIPADIAGLTSGVIALAAGGFHTCALTASGGIKCWGSNSWGELGNGTTTQSLAPVDVSGLTFGAIAVSASSLVTCAVLANGTARCWGRNDLGQLGNNSAQSSRIPVDVPGLTTGVRAVAAGNFHTCALTDGGAVKCWGINDQGQLGNGTTVNPSAAVNVTGLSSGVASIATGGGYDLGAFKVGGFSCALMAAGTVKCWGGNEKGQLGVGTTAPGSIPADVLGLPAGIKAISAGTLHACALTGGGAVKCWGYNGAGQLGNGTMTEGATATPVDVVGLSNAVALAAGGYHTCALTSLGGVKCWGNNNNGALGNGTYVQSSIPVDVTGLTTGIAAISAGDGHSCARTNGGGIKCWGWNRHGRLGDGTQTDASSPIDVVGFPVGSQGLAAGANSGSTCALTAASGAVCWGDLIDSRRSTAYSTVPVDVPELSAGVAALAPGRYHTCALTVAGGVQCWGFSDVPRNSVLGTPRVEPAPVSVLVGPTPNPFAFASATLAAPGSVQTSASVTITGIEAATPVSVAGGSYSIGCGGSFTTGAATIANGQTVCVRHTAASTPNTRVTTTLTVGGVDGTFTSLATACGNFSDVAVADFYCNNVEWLKNRAVTLGCTVDAFCPHSTVSRNGMAAFMNRLGIALTTQPILVQGSPGIVDIDAAPLICQSTDLPPAGHPRSVMASWYFSGLAAGPLVASASVLRSNDGGATWFDVAPAMRDQYTSARWRSMSGAFGYSLVASESVRFAMRVVRPANGGSADFADSTCQMLLQIANRNNIQSPFDDATP